MIKNYYLLFFLLLCFNNTVCRLASAHILNPIQQRQTTQIISQNQNIQSYSKNYTQKQPAVTTHSQTQNVSSSNVKKTNSQNSPEKTLQNSLKQDPQLSQLINNLSQIPDATMYKSQLKQISQILNEEYPNISTNQFEQIIQKKFPALKPSSTQNNSHDTSKSISSITNSKAFQTFETIGGAAMSYEAIKGIVHPNSTQKTIEQSKNAIESKAATQEAEKKIVSNESKTIAATTNASKTEGIVGDITKGLSETATAAEEFLPEIEAGVEELLPALL
jgi:hypothetical protein